MNIGKVDAAFPASSALASGTTETTQATREEEIIKAAEKAKTDSVSFTGQDEKQTQLERWKELLKQLSSSENKIQMSQSLPKSSVKRLTQRLVSATNQVDVRTVMSEASREITSLSAAAAGLEGKQRMQVEAMIRAAKKLLDRCSRKIEDLGKEDMVRGKHKKAEQAQQEKRAEQLKNELRRMMIERAQRERKYLEDTGPDKVQASDVQAAPGAKQSQYKLDASTEAKIEALAQAMAAAELAAGSPDVSVSGGDIGGEVAAGGDAPAGGEAAPAEGGGEAAPAAE